MSLPRLPKHRIIGIVLSLISLALFLGLYLKSRFFIFPQAAALFYLTHLMAILLRNPRKACPASITTYGFMIASYAIGGIITGQNIASTADLAIMTASWLSGLIDYMQFIKTG